MKFSDVTNAKSDTCDMCLKQTTYAELRYIAVDGSACYCAPCFKAKQKSDRKAHAAAKLAVAAIMANDMAKAAVVLAPIVNHLKATLEVA
jgi:hypothetical protein